MSETHTENNHCAEKDEMVATKHIITSYTIYILVHELLIIGGCGFITFGLNHSYWWWALAIIFSLTSYIPGDWHGLLTGKHRIRND